MKRLVTIILAGILCAWTVASATEEWAGVFLNPERDQWQMPHLVMRLMGVQTGEKAAAIGTESGLYVRWLSRWTGGNGVVYYVSPDKGAVEYIRNPDGFALPDHLNAFLAAPDDPALPKGELDHLLLVNSLHTVQKRARYFKDLARTLKPTGRLTIIDWQQGEIENAPPEEKRLSRDSVVAELTEAGWSLVTESVALPYQYLLIFHPPGAE